MGQGALCARLPNCACESLAGIRINLAVVPNFENDNCHLLDGIN